VVQQFANYYLRPGIGDLIAVGLLAVFLLVRPAGILGRERI
jgi:branched-subunit amino acid ABC-type transport system permease component